MIVSLGEDSSPGRDRDDDLRDEDNVFIFPTSFAQQRLWLLDQIEGCGSAYNEPLAMWLRGPINAAVLEESLNEVVRRHEVLRTSFGLSEGQPVQMVAPTVTLVLTRIDLRTVEPSNRVARASQVVREEVRRPFDLARGPLIRATLLQLSPDQHVLVLVMHHIVTDGWSMRVLLQELSQLYPAFADGRPSPLAELPIQYADFAAWQRDRLRGETIEPLFAYWERELAEAPPLVTLPGDRPRPSVQTFVGARHALTIPPYLVAVLRDVSRRERVTLYMFLLSAFQVLLGCYSGQDDVVVGSPAAGRGREETENLIGFFLNTLVLRADLADDPPFQELLTRVREHALGAYAHQELPFELLVERLKLARDRSRTPLFQVMFVFQDAPDEALDLPGVTVAPFLADGGTAKFDVTVSLMTSARGIDGYIEFNVDLFDAATIEQFAESFGLLLRAVASNPSLRISELSWLGERQLQQLAAWNATAVTFPDDVGLATLFEQQAERTPDAVAVVCDATSLTYRELNRRANQLAHRLRRLGITRESIVGLCAEPSLDVVIGLFAILKAGGAYLPLDPTFPRERLAFMLEDARPVVVFGQERLRDRLPAGVVPVLWLDAESGVIAEEDDENLQPVATAANLAYVLYTSGSTGAPKGVLGLQRATINRLRWMWDIYPFASDEVCCHKTALGWVDSVWEIFGPLLRGVRLVIMMENARKDPRSLVQTLSEERVTRLVLVPSLLQAIIDTCDQLETRLSRLRYCVTSGEAVSVELWQAFQQKLPGCVLINLYGSSEVAADVTVFDSRFGSLGASVPIGRPIANTQVYLLDRRRALVPIGTPGELYVGGAGLARGYLNRPELTAERFIADPFSLEPGARLYRTGDLARFRPDGNLDYLGRVDRQVKVRGFRIELGEIEAALRQHPDLSESAVLLREDEPGDKLLVGYVVPKERPGPSADSLRIFLDERLPAFMLPSAFVVLDALPRIFNGKLDRRALPAPKVEQSDDLTAYVGPRNLTEVQFVRIWEEVLGVRPIGVRDDFFRLGGHSLLAVRLLAAVEKQFGSAPPLVSLFPSVTIEHLAQQVARSNPFATGSVLVPIQPRGAGQPLFCIHGLGGGVADYAYLAHHLGPNQQVFGLQADWYDANGKLLTTLEAMGEHYVAVLRAAQSEGPYALVGHSFGGVLAFEIARQLAAGGQRVSLLAVLDTVAPGSAYYRMVWQLGPIGGFLQNFPYWLSDFVGLGRRGMLARMRRVTRTRLKGLISRLGHRSASALEVHLEDVLDDLSDIAADRQAFMAAQCQAVWDYDPSVYPGRVTLFRARRQPLFCTFDPEMGWGRLAAGGVDVRVVPGNHVQMIFEPYVRTLAEKLESLLG